MTPEVLVSAIRERLDEIERKADDATPGPWKAEPASRPLPGHKPWPSDYISPAGHFPRFRTYSEQDAAHIVLHDPSSVLRRVQADRQIIDQYEAAVGALAAQKEWWDARRRGEPEDDGGVWTDRMVDGWKARGAVEALLPVICDLAFGLGIDLPEAAGGDDG